MKTKSLILLISFSLLFLSSCRPQKSDSQDSGKTEQTADELRSLPDYNYTDSLMQGSHEVVYTITRQPDDDLPTVVDEDGVKYKDNRFNLHIVKDGKKLFERDFTKADFKSQLPDEFKKYGIMDGLRFHHAEEGKLYFNACVSFPESDMICPFLLTIGPDGSFKLAPDTTFGEEDEDFPSV